MKKILVLIILSIPLVSCSNNNPVDFTPVKNNYSGYYEIHLTGKFSGASTIVLMENGLINNGIVMKMFDSLEVICYANSYVDDNGFFNSNFFCDKQFYLLNDTLNIKSISGNISGTFAPDTAKGYYDICLVDSGCFNGYWYAIKLK
jgi:hypothetical protein